jgi:dienelactone hydrolase
MRRIQALGVYGEGDERINSTLPTVVAAMQSDGKTFNHEVYPGTGHGFLHPDARGRTAGGAGLEVDLDFYHARLGKR